MRVQLTSYLTFISLLVLIGCGPGTKDKNALIWHAPAPRETIMADTLRIPVYDFDRLEPLLHQKDSTTYVINFWATWCAPCVREIPIFERIASEYDSEKVRVILVNLDMPSMWKTQLVPFVRDRRLSSSVVVLDDLKQNSWIPKVDESWSGAIPATLIYRQGKRRFYEASFTYEKLQNILYNF